MLGNWAKCTTSTTGTGNLTLSSVSGFPTFANVFALNQPASYCLLDSSDHPIEAGIGYLSSSTTFVRARVEATYISATYTNVGATAATLSGTTTVIATPHAGSMEFTQPTVDSVSSSVGRYLSSAARSLAFTSLAVTLNRLVYTPFVLHTPCVVNALAINVGTAQASAIVKTGIYAIGPDGYIGALLASAPDIDASTTGFKASSLASAIFLPAGTYFTAAVASGSASAPSLSCYAQTTANFIGGSPLGFSSGAVTAIDSRYETLSAGAALPSTPSAATTGSAIGSVNAPVVMLGVS